MRWRLIATGTLGAVKPAGALSRRSLLGLAALGLAACTKGSSPAHQAHQEGVDPDASALAAAIASEHALIAVSEAAGLTTQLGLHRAHLAAMGGSVITPSATAAPIGTQRIRSLLRSNAAMLRGSAVAAVSGAHAALLSSIAASHEAMSRE